MNLHMKILFFCFKHVDVLVFLISHTFCFLCKLKSLSESVVWFSRAVRHILESGAELRGRISFTLEP